MADSIDDSGKDTVISSPPTEEEKRTETVDDEVRPKEGPESDSKDGGPDVSARLDALEKELAALKAMMDTLGYAESSSDDDDGDGDDDGESIEDLFD